MKRSLPYIVTLSLLLSACSTIGQAAGVSLDPTAALQTSVAQQVSTLAFQQTVVAQQVQTMSAALPTATPKPTLPPAPEAATAIPTATKVVIATPIPGPVDDPDNDLTSQGWGQAPIIPTVSDRAREIYQTGLLMGNDPRHYSVAGDCQSIPEVFMGVFDGDRYRLSDEDLALAGNDQQF